jgi:hypothetical protein
MIIIIGLVILIAAVVAGVVGVLSNSGSGHPLTHPFAALGYHVTGSTGTLFLYGIVSLLLAGARRTSRRGREARRGLTQSRRETAAVTQDRDDLASYGVSHPRQGGGRALHPGPYPPDLSRCHAYGALPPVPVRMPSGLARRTRALWQSWHVPALSALLPALPSTSRIRLRSASTRLLRQPGEKAFHLLRLSAPHGAPAPHGARGSRLSVRDGRCERLNVSSPTRHP